MPKFLFEASYTLDGIKGVQNAGGTSRRDAVAQVAESVGGQLESFYFAFGDHDAYVVVDLPDHESAAAVALTVNAAGGATVRTVVLLTPDEGRRRRQALGRIPPAWNLTRRKDAGGLNERAALHSHRLSETPEPVTHAALPFENGHARRHLSRKPVRLLRGPTQCLGLALDSFGLPGMRSLGATPKI